MGSFLTSRVKPYSKTKNQAACKHIETYILHALNVTKQYRRRKNEICTFSVIEARLKDC